MNELRRSLSAMVVYLRMAFFATTAMATAYIVGSQFVDQRFGIVLAIGAVIVPLAYLYGEHRGARIILKTLERDRE